VLVLVLAIVHQTGQLLPLLARCPLSSVLMHTARRCCCPCPCPSCCCLRHIRTCVSGVGPS